MPILLVEDDAIDTEAVRRALKKENVSNPLVSACDGIEALEILTGQNGQEKIPQPCLVLLDINLPRMNGLQLLEEMRKDDSMRQNVVFMLTTSARDHDKLIAYNLQIAAYVLKENLPTLARLIADYSRINEMP
jgi:CheY-like chemotaxis protein